MFALEGDSPDLLLLALFAVLMLAFVAGLIWVFIGVINRNNQLPHGAFSHTRNISTLPINEEMLDKVGQPFPQGSDPLPPAPGQGPMLNA